MKGLWDWLIARSLAKEQKLLKVIRDLGDNAYGVPIHCTSGMGIGSMYAALNALEEGGYVTSTWGEATPERGGYRKRFYRLTEAGLARLKVSQ